MLDPELNRARVREWREANLERARAKCREWYAKNKEVAKARASEWAKQNKERRAEITSASAKKVRAENPERIRSYNRRRRQDPAARLHDSCSTMMRIALRQKKNGSSWESLVGFTIAQLVTHLERQFLPGMTWANYGEWHVDHIVPVTRFSFSCAEDPEFKACWSMGNLRPLWAADNIRKSNRRTHLL